MLTRCCWLLSAELITQLLLLRNLSGWRRILPDVGVCFYISAFYWRTVLALRYVLTVRRWDCTSHRCADCSGIEDALSQDAVNDFCCDSVSRCCRRLVTLMCSYSNWLIIISKLFPTEITCINVRYRRMTVVKQKTHLQYFLAFLL